MSTIVVYDSTYGNTEKLAKSMGDAMAAGTKVTRANEVNPFDLDAVDLLIIGSPTLGGRPMLSIQTFLVKYSDRIKGVDVAAFDSRLSAKWVGVFGYASNKIANSLKQSGGNLIAPPGGFFVKGKPGPLKDEEIEHAADWAKAIVENRKKG